MAEQQESKPVIEIQTGDLDEKSRARLKEAVERGGMTLREVPAGGGVRPAQLGEIETVIELDTAGLDETGVQRLRERAYANDKHSRILEAVLKGAVEGYGVKAGVVIFVEWLWCQWNKYAARDDLAPKEAFKKRYAVRPSVEALPKSPAEVKSGATNW